MTITGIAPPLCVTEGPHKETTSFSDLKSFQVHSIEEASFFSVVNIFNMVASEKSHQDLL